MGTFVTNPAEELFDDKEPAPGQSLPPGWTNNNVARAEDLNALRDAAYDLRTHSLGVATTLAATQSQLTTLSGQVDVLGTEIDTVADDLADYIASGGVPDVIAAGSTAPRALVDRFADALSLRDFGAVGDGETPDDAALTAAAASGRRIRVTPGTYLCTLSNLVFADGTVFEAEDPATCIIAFAATTSGEARAIKLNGEGSGIRNLGLNILAGKYGSAVWLRADRTFAEYNKVNYSSPDLTAADFVVNPYLGIYPFYATDGSSIYTDEGAPDGSRPLYDVRVVGNDIQVAASSGPGLKIGDVMQFVGLRRALIERNRIHDCVSIGDIHHNWGIYISKRCDSVHVIGNIIEDNVGVGGIHFNDNPNEGGFGTMSNTYAVRNRIKNSINGGTNGATIGISSEFCSGVVIAHNDIRDTVTGVHVSSSGVIDAGFHTKIVHNHFEGLYDSLDITPSKYIQIDDESRNILVQGNTFAASGNATNYAVICSAPYCKIDNNFFDPDCAKQPVEITGGGVDCSFTNNTVRASALATGGLVSIRRARGIVTGNRIEHTAGAGGGYGLRLEGDSIVCEQNIITGTGANAVNVQGGTGVAVRDNALTASGTVLADAGTGTVKHNNTINGLPTRKSGKATFSGNGATTAFVIPHGLSANPGTSFAQAASADARAGGTTSVSTSSANITVTFAVAPPSGASNVVIAWTAEV